MEDRARQPVAMTIDLKKNRIRVHKTTLHMMGDPGYLQLLVNPGEMLVAIRGVNKPHLSDSLHRVSPGKLRSDNSYEIYSMAFIAALYSLIGKQNQGYLLHLSGKVLPTKDAAVFSLKTMSRTIE